MNWINHKEIYTVNRKQLNNIHNEWLNTENIQLFKRKRGSWGTWSESFHFQLILLSPILHRQKQTFCLILSNKGLIWRIMWGNINLIFHLICMIQMTKSVFLCSTEIMSTADRVISSVSEISCSCSISHINVQIEILIWLKWVLPY